MHNSAHDGPRLSAEEENLTGSLPPRAASCTVVLAVSPAIGLRGRGAGEEGVRDVEKGEECVRIWYVFSLAKPGVLSEKVPGSPDFCSAVCLQLRLPRNKTSSLAQGNIQARLLFVVFKFECLF